MRLVRKKQTNNPNRKEKHTRTIWIEASEKILAKERTLKRY